MLRLVLVVTQFGIVLYKKEFQRLVAQPSLTGSLLSAMLDLCVKSVHLPLSYIEMSTVAVSIAVDMGRTGLICALFTDVADGADFGTRLATELLSNFLETYPDAADQSCVVDTSVYTSFHTKMPDCLRGTARRVLSELAGHRGVVNCVLARNEAVLYASSPADELGLVANLNAILSTARDIMSLPEDKPKTIAIQGRKTNMIVCPLQSGGTIVVVLKKSANASSLQPQIDRTRLMTDQAYSHLVSLQGGS